MHYVYVYSKFVQMLHCVYLQQEIRILKMMFKNKTGFKKYINITIKLHSDESYSPIILNRMQFNALSVYIYIYIQIKATHDHRKGVYSL